MKNVASWKPGKFIMRRGRLRGSPDPAELSPGSRLIGDLVAGRLQKALEKHASGRLLDLGCGKVPLFGVYRDLVEEVTCVDWSGSIHGDMHLDCVADLSSGIPFRNGSFDTVILSDVLEHLPDPVPAWTDLSRVLAPGGKALLTVPFLYGLHEVPHDYHRYTEHSLRRSAVSAGLEVLELEAMGGAMEVLADIQAKAMLTISSRFLPFASAVQRAAAILGRTRPGRRIRVRTAERFPLAYMMVAGKPVSPQEPAP